MAEKMIVGQPVGGKWEPVGFLQVTHRTGTYAFTPSDVVGITGGAISMTNNQTAPRFCTIQSDVSNVVFTDVTAVTPTTATGQRVSAGTPPQIYCGDMTKLQLFIATGSAQIALYR